jgi:hypothetical protein
MRRTSHTKVARPDPAGPPATISVRYIYLYFKLLVYLIKIGENYSDAGI